MSSDFLKFDPVLTFGITVGVLTAEIKDKLCCPNCKHSLISQPETYECCGCSASYPVHQGIPILLSKELRDFQIPTSDKNILFKRAELNFFDGNLDNYWEGAKSGFNANSPQNKKIRTWVDQFLGELTEEKQVLDLGGAFSNRLAVEKIVPKNFVVVDIAKNILLKHKLDVNKVVSDCEDIPFRDDSFDYVIAESVLHHVPRKEQALREILRVTKPGGTILLIEPSKWSVALLYYLIKRTVFYFWGVKGLNKFLGYYGSPTESFISLQQVKKQYQKSVDLHFEKSQPLRLPYVKYFGVSAGYFKLMNGLEKSFLNREMVPGSFQ